MRKLLLVTLTALITTATMTAETLWLRYPAISPDGKTIAFNYKGNIYTVGINGGKAKCVMNHEAYDYRPIWSPDGTRIAFASDRYGNFDIFTVPASGGEATRVTTHSNDEEPWAFTPDGSSIYFSANIHTSAASREYTKRAHLRELYSVCANGGRPQLILPTSTEEVSFLANGKDFIYEDRPGFEEIWRKHHTSAVARDIWIYKDGHHTKLTDFKGEDRVPRLAADGKTVYFLSERNGSFNVFSFPLDRPQEITCHTDHKLHPVRSLTIAANGTLCYSYDGEIYTKTQNKEPKKVRISIPAGSYAKPEIKTLQIKSSDCAAVSPDGSQMVFAFRGELYVTTTDENSQTRRITSTVASESDPAFAPDGRTLVYATERQGKWNLFSITLGEEDGNFISAGRLIEKPLFADTDYDRRMPKFSPDGKELAFIENRDRLMVMNLADGTVRQITDGSHIINTWGTYPYSWSPDGKWFVLEGDITEHKTNILIVNASGKEPIMNLTRSGYPDSEPVWALGGDAVLFLSQRYGTYDHSRLGGGSRSLFMFFLNKESQERYTTPLKRHSAMGITAPDMESIRPVDIDSMLFNDRLVRLTNSTVTKVITDKAGKYAYGISSRKLVRIDLRKSLGKMEVLGNANGTLAFDSAEKSIFVLGSNPKRYDIASGKFTQISVSGEYQVDPAAEYLFMLDHITNEMRQRFYDINMHGTDWEMYCKAYRRHVPHINNNHDFSELAGELLGELNVSHTGLRYDRPVLKSHDATAELGLYIDYNYNGAGLKVEEILAGGPFDYTTSRLEAGDIIEKINDTAITPGMDYFPLLNRKAGKKVTVSICKASGEKIEESVYPISRKEYDNLIYQRWMARCAAEVERLSNGRIGYVHLDFMNKHAYHHLYLTTLGRYYNCDALVVDVRNNGGGSLHPKLEEFFCGTQYLTGAIRGKRIKDMPRRRWIRPSAMLINPGCYSDGHGGPWVYDHLDLGTTVGTPIPGTMTTCNREKQRDRSLILGIPIVGFYTREGNSLENSQTEPDVYVENKKEAIANGQDQQLEAVVKLLLEQVETHPKRSWRE